MRPSRGTLSQKNSERVQKAMSAANRFEIGRASCKGKSVDLGGRRIIKKKKEPVCRFTRRGTGWVRLTLLDAKGRVPQSHRGLPIAAPKPIRRFFFQAEDGIRDYKVTGGKTCALPI